MCNIVYYEKALMDGLLMETIFKLLDLTNLQIILETCYLLSALVSANSNIIDILIENGVVSKLLYLIKTNHRDVY